MNFLQYLFALLIGIVMGLIGGGGSIITLPVLKYSAQMDAVTATGYSLFIVGLSAAIGALLSHRKGQVHWPIALKFAVPSFIAVYLTRGFIVPALPDPLFSMGDLQLSRDTGLMLLFVVIMIAAALAMLRKKKARKEEIYQEIVSPPFWKVMLEGLVIGVLTGLVGAGGGFLIVPALVLLTKLPMKVAIGTSLAIIAAKSLIGFIGDVQTAQNIDWPYLLSFSGMAIIGIAIGSRLSRAVPAKQLKRGFAYFVLAMAAWITYTELT